MESKLNFINLDNYCYKYNIARRLLYDISFWDIMLGEGCFDLDFLKEEFQNEKNKIVIGYDNNKSKINNIEGVLIYKKVKNKNLYIIGLMAKKYESKYYWYGKKVLKFLKTTLKPKSSIILLDDTDIPNYYIKLGFILKNKKKYRKIMDNDHYDIYKKTL